MRTKTFIFSVLSIILALTFTACPELINNVQEKTNTGSISGKAVFSNGGNNRDITVTLERTNGLQTASVINANKQIAAGGRSIDSGRTLVAQTNAALDGSYSFPFLSPGLYTIYASSKDSKERAVLINLTLSEGQSITAPQLNLTSVGEIKGRITIDSKEDGNFGFLVSVAGTSYMAVTNDKGEFTITDIPQAHGYLLIIMRKNYLAFWDYNQITVTGTPRDVGTKNLLSAVVNAGGAMPDITIGDNGNWFVNEVDTGVKATGPQGDPGQNGTTPRIDTVTGTWWIGDTDTGIKAAGSNGEPGTPGLTPHIDMETGTWWIGDEDTGLPVLCITDPQGFVTVKGFSLSSSETIEIGEKLTLSSDNKSVVEIFNLFNRFYIYDYE